MSEAIYIPLAIQAADDGFKAMQAVFDDAKNRHDSAKLAAADRAQLMMLMVQIAGYLKTQTNWIMSISQPLTDSESLRVGLNSMIDTTETGGRVNE